MKNFYCLWAKEYAPTPCVHGLCKASDYRKEELAEAQPLHPEQTMNGTRRIWSLQR